MKYDRKAQERSDKKDFRVKQENDSERSRKKAIETLRKLKQNNR